MTHRSVSIHEAKTHLSRLLAGVERGEEVVVRRGDRPIARIVRWEAPAVERRPGALRGKVRVSEDFDAPLDDFADYS